MKKKELEIRIADLELEILRHGEQMVNGKVPNPLAQGLARKALEN